MAPHSLVQSEVIVQDDDVIMREVSEESDGFIPLDPETIAEEKELLETRLYNEFDLEGMTNPMITDSSNWSRGGWL